MSICTGHNCQKEVNPLTCKETDTCEFASLISDDTVRELRDILHKQFQKTYREINDQMAKTTEFMKPPEPVKIPYDSMIGNYPCCQCEKPKFLEDCYYFFWEQDMAAKIPICDVNETHEPKCSKECPNYITREQVSKLVKNHLATRKEFDDVKNVKSYEKGI